MQIFLIQGFFFQNYGHLGLKMSNTGEGVVSTIVYQMTKFMFSGVIYPDMHSAKRVLCGDMWDQIGWSTLSGVRISPDELSFTKKYDGKESYIQYNFKNENGLWVGRYFGEESGEGSAKCILTETTENIFIPPE